MITSSVCTQFGLVMRFMLIFLGSLLNTNIFAIKVFKMLEDLESLNKPTKARVTNFDLGQLSEITICIRVYFYHFPVKTKYDLKWFSILSSSEAGDILFSVAAFDTGRKSGDLEQVIPAKIFQSKDVKNIIFDNKKFMMIRYVIIVKLQAKIQGPSSKCGLVWS